MQLEAAIKELELICQRSRKLSISFLLLMSVKTTLTAMMASFAMVLRLRYAIYGNDGKVCYYGTSVVCNDGLACTSDSCNEATDMCEHQPKTWSAPGQSGQCLEPTGKCEYAAPLPQESR